MESFAGWLKENAKGRPIFISDNNGFDWQFVNWYFWRFTGGNPFWPFKRKSGLALQGHGQGHVPKLQALTQNAAHAQSG